MTKIDTEEQSREAQASFTPHDLSERWHVCKPTLRSWERQGKIKAIRFNARVVRYPATEVERLEKEGMV